MLFEIIVTIAACFDSSVIKAEHQYADLNVCWQKANRKWSSPMTERDKYLPPGAVDIGGKGTAMAESSILVHRESTSMVFPTSPLSRVVV